ncbi:MAG: hypothetical protein AB8G99_06485 [Planctomycetaceae bacterium]
MLDAEADILSLDLDCFRLLQNYRQSGLAEKAERAKEEAAKQKAAAQAVPEPEEVSPAEEAEQPESDEEVPKPQAFNVEKGEPWLDRVCELDGVEDEDLCKIHGKLIAAGFLNFQIRNRITGIEYRVANAGKQYLTKTLEQASELAADSESRDTDGSDAEPDDASAIEEAA